MVGSLGQIGRMIGRVGAHRPSMGVEVAFAFTFNGQPFTFGGRSFTYGAP